MEKLLDLTDKIPSLKHIVVIEEENTIGGDVYSRAKEAGVGIHYFADLLKAGEEQLIDDKTPSPDDVHIICYTSGTTGTPKGVSSHVFLVSIASYLHFR